MVHPKLPREGDEDFVVPLLRQRLRGAQSAMQRIICLVII